MTGATDGRCYFSLISEKYKYQCGKLKSFTKKLKIYELILKSLVIMCWERGSDQKYSSFLMVFIKLSIFNIQLFTHQQVHLYVWFKQHTSRCLCSGSLSLPKSLLQRHICVNFVNTGMSKVSMNLRKKCTAYKCINVNN